ncbi:hypothetical protein HPB50_026143 [Hyalomma asiaticum]|uniref:Uncharacterized protein n=1 Tax=Hyalomma asiaticum TaxID=266040 RepID=A0ACB7SCJ2_HYAAI|nr:hypothetical protein HPB50_026143 [Hyalomma asiaticum]
MAALALTQHDLRACRALQCHFLTQPCCPTLTCIRFTRTTGMNGICMLDVHSGDDYSVPIFSTPEGRAEVTPSLPPLPKFTLPPSPTGPGGMTHPVTQHYCCTAQFTCNRR